MRIATFIFIIIFAVVSLAARAVGWQRGIRSISNNSDNSEGSSSESSGDSQSGEVKRHAAGQWLSAESALKLISEEASRTGASPCCPSTLEMIEPAGGVNPEGLFVELYSDGLNQQRFYEVSCQVGIEGRPCRYLPHKLHNQSTCVQKYSYTYALVKDTSRDTNRPHHMRTSQTQFVPPAGMGDWMLDYIRVRSGCSCELRPKNQHYEKAQKRNSKERKGKKNRSRSKLMSKNLH